MKYKLFLFLYFLVALSSGQAVRIIKGDTCKIVPIFVDTCYFHEKGFFLVPDSLDDGNWIIYYNNYKLYSKYKIQNKKLSGVAEYFWWNGKIMAKENNVNGVLDGERSYYNKKGKLLLISYWKNGKATGIWRKYNDSGQFVKEEDHNND